MTRILQLFLLLLPLMPNLAIAQSGQRMNIPVTENSKQLLFPFAGGLNHINLSTGDLNQDAKKDLFLFDHSAQTAEVWLNAGNAWQYAPEYQQQFPPVSGFALLRDFNCDAKPDLFTADGSRIILWKMTASAPVLQYQSYNTGIQSDYSGTKQFIYLEPGDVPVIEDLDGDGDIDLMVYDITGIRVELHINQSVQNYGTCDSLEFIAVNTCWGKFEENNADNSITLNVACKANTKSPVHAGSSLCIFDHEQDGDPDLLIGDAGYKTLVYLRNSTNLASAIIDSIDYSFPGYDQPVIQNFFPAAYYEDVDFDNVKDLIIAPNAGASINVRNIWLYRRSNPGPFSFEKDAFLQEDMIDVGSRAFPVLMDYNADGLQDLIIGNHFYNSDTGIFGALSLYLNTGTANAPVYDLNTRNLIPFSGVLLQADPTGIVPTVGDLDLDGDVDLVVGDADGKIHYFQNNAGPGNPALFQLAAGGQNYNNIDAGQYAAPFIYDLNGDSLPDLIIGKMNGSINYYQNIGFPGFADFDSVPTITNLGNVDVEPLCCTGNNIPYLYKDAGTQSTVLLCGSESGYIFRYDNIDGNLGGTFSLTDSSFLDAWNGMFSSISGGDLDGDGKHEWLTGNERGGIVIYDDVLLDAAWADAGGDRIVTLAGNPSDALHLRSQSKEPVQVQLIEPATGRQVAALSFSHEAVFHFPELASGIYIIRYTSGSHTGYLKWVMVR